MTITIPRLDEAYSCKLELYDEMTKFVERCQSEVKDFTKMKFEVGLGEAGYYESKEAYYGWCGYSGIPDSLEKSKDERKSYSKDSEVLLISFGTTLDQYRSVEEKIKTISVTPGGRGNIHKVCNPLITKKIEIVEIGLYKKEFFEEGFNLLKKIHPDITEKEFAVFGTKSSKESYVKEDHLYREYAHQGEYRRDFVEELPFKGDEGCIMTREEYVTTEEYDEKVEMKFSIMTIDIERNTDLLIEIMNSL